LEDGIREGGYGQMIASYLGDREIVVKNYGLEKKFYDNYRAADVLSELGITVETITKDIMEQLQQSIH
jgi:1-deoxy-D-xylulose-5-phosphate synthase